MPRQSALLIDVLLRMRACQATVIKFMLLKYFDSEMNAIVQQQETVDMCASAVHILLVQIHCTIKTLINYCTKM